MYKLFTVLPSNIYPDHTLRRAFAQSASPEGLVVRLMVSTIAHTAQCSFQMALAFDMLSIFQLILD